jgi:hypothetical protein
VKALPFKKKAQSSVEYLGTYVWAFIGLIVTIGALNYFGIFNPSNYTAEQCESGSQLSCEDTAVYTNPSTHATDILLMIKNNYPRTIRIISANISSFETTIYATEQENIVIDPGRAVLLHFNTNQQLIVGQKEPISFSLDYQRYGGTTTHTITGKGTINVQEASGAVAYCGDDTIDSSLGETCDPPTTFSDDLPNWANTAGECAAGLHCKSDCTCGS